MFGNASKPCRVYRYGCRPPSANLPLVEEQMHRAHKYRNALVEAERSRRAEIDKLVTGLSPELAATEAAIGETEAVLERACEAIRAASGEVRKKVRPEGLVLEAKNARASLKTLRAKRKELRAALFASEAFKAAQEKSDLVDGELRKRLRAESGLYWGNYLIVEQSMGGCRSGAPPKFMRWNGDGHLAVQIQKGMTVAELFSNTDPRLGIRSVPESAWGPGGRTQRRTVARFRIGSDEKGGPVFAEIPLVLHRPIPADARIKWAHLLRERIATNCRWSLQLVLERNSWERSDTAAGGSVGIDVGWRMKEDGSLRVAVWKGSDGAEGEVALDKRWLGGMRQVRDLQSIRGKGLDAMRVLFLPQARDLAWPEALELRAKGVHLWESPARFAALAIFWGEHRFAGDETAYMTLEAWHRRDVHLYKWERNLLDKLLARRQDIYRVFAAQLRRAYRTAVIEDLDLRDFHVLPPDEAAPDPAEGALREHVRDAGLSYLVSAIEHSVAKVVHADPKDTTRRCHACGLVRDFPREKLFHTCACGVSWDQDMNAAINLLGMAGKEEVSV